jgi:hypothetical protein
MRCAIKEEVGFTRLPHTAPTLKVTTDTMVNSMVMKLLQVIKRLIDAYVKAMDFPSSTKKMD